MGYLWKLIIEFLLKNFDFVTGNFLKNIPHRQFSDSWQIFWFLAKFLNIYVLSNIWWVDFSDSRFIISNGLLASEFWINCYQSNDTENFHWKCYPMDIGSPQFRYHDNLNLKTFQMKPFNSTIKAKCYDRMNITFTLHWDRLDRQLFNSLIYT